MAVNNLLGLPEPESREITKPKPKTPKKSLLDIEDKTKSEEKLKAKAKPKSKRPSLLEAAEKTSAKPITGPRSLKDKKAEEEAEQNEINKMRIMQKGSKAPMVLARIVVNKNHKEPVWKLLPARKGSSVMDVKMMLRMQMGAMPTNIHIYNNKFMNSRVPDDMFLSSYTDDEDSIMYIWLFKN